MSCWRNTIAIKLFKVERSEPEIVNLDRPIFFVGRATETNTRTVSRDIPKLSKQFKRLKQGYPIPNKHNPWGFVLATKGYNPNTGNMQLMMGDVVTSKDSMPSEDLSVFEIPTGLYAIFPIKPKASFLWAYTIIKTKQYIFTEWLPNSEYEPAGTVDDFEYHDERSVFKHPQVDLYIAIKKKL